MKPVESECGSLTRKEREYLRHRREIIEAAESVFAEKGFISATMEEIAQRAEFAVGTLYKFFDTKTDLYAATAHLRADELEQEVLAVISADIPAVEKIRRYFFCRMGQFWRRPDFFRLFVLGTSGGGGVPDPRSGFLPELVERYDRLLIRIDDIFRSGKEDGVFRDAKPRLLTLSLEGVLRSYLVHLIRKNAGTRSEEDEEALFQLFSQGILARLPGGQK